MKVKRQTKYQNTFNLFNLIYIDCHRLYEKSWKIASGAVSKVRNTMIFQLCVTLWFLCESLCNNFLITIPQSYTKKTQRTTKTFETAPKVEYDEGYMGYFLKFLLLCKSLCAIYFRTESINQQSEIWDYLKLLNFKLWPSD